MPTPRAERVSALLVDDEADVHSAFRRVLTSAGVRVRCVESGSEALAAIARDSFDVVVSDVMMPGMSGTELLRAIRQHDLELPVILVSGVPSLQTAMEAVELGAYRYLSKPIAAKVLTEHVVRAAHLGRLATLKREGMEALGSLLPQAGDRIGLALTFDRAMASLHIAYQPIVRASDRTLFGYEALMRSGEAALPHPGAILDAAQRLDAIPSIEPEIVKLDMSLIRDLDTTTTKQKLVRTMTELCHELGMLVVAEGIETVAERDCAVALGCDLLQGYLLARPGPAFPSFAWP